MSIDTSSIGRECAVYEFVVGRPLIIHIYTYILPQTIVDKSLFRGLIQLFSTCFLGSNSIHCDRYKSVLVSVAHHTCTRTHIYSESELVCVVGKGRGGICVRAHLTEHSVLLESTLADNDP